MYCCSHDSAKFGQKLISCKLRRRRNQKSFFKKFTGESPAQRSLLTSFRGSGLARLISSMEQSFACYPSASNRKISSALNFVLFIKINIFFSLISSLSPPLSPLINRPYPQTIILDAHQHRSMTNSTTQSGSNSRLGRSKARRNNWAV